MKTINSKDGLNDSMTIVHIPDELSKEEVEALIREKNECDKLLVQLDQALKEANNAHIQLMQENQKKDKQIQLLIAIKKSNEETIRLLKQAHGERFAQLASEYERNNAMIREVASDSDLMGIDPN